MNDTVIFLILALLAAAFKGLTALASKSAKNPPPPQPNEPPVRQPPQSEAERVRRFLEALGAPPGTEPPPPVRPRPAAPRPSNRPEPARRRPAARPWEQPLPPLTTAPPFLREPAPPPVLSAPPPPPPVVALPRPTPLAAPPVSAPRPAAGASSLGEMLRRRESVRQAILLREILGPPRGLAARAETSLP